MNHDLSELLRVLSKLTDNWKDNAKRRETASKSPAIMPSTSAVHRDVGIAYSSCADMLHYIVKEFAASNE